MGGLVPIIIRLGLAAFGVVSLARCSAPKIVPVEVKDGGHTDGPDGGPDPKDSGPDPVDSGIDAGSDAGYDGGDVFIDAGDPDSGPVDSGTPDAGQPDAGIPDAGQPDAGQPDAGQPDAGPTCNDTYPEQAGVTRCWSFTPNCQDKDDIVVTQGGTATKVLHRLCAGVSPRNHRIVSCPTSTNINPVSCTDPYVALNWTGSFTPIAMSDIGNNYSIVTFMNAAHQPGIFVVDRLHNQVTDAELFPNLVYHTGVGDITFSLEAPPMMSVALFQGNLVLPMNVPNQNDPSMKSGIVVLIPWHGDTGSFDRMTQNRYKLFNTTSPNPTGFLKESETAMRVIEGGDATHSPGLDYLYLQTMPDQTQRVDMNYSENLPINASSLRPLTHPATSGNQSAIVLASGAQLLGIKPEDPNAPFCSPSGLTASAVMATQWYNNGTADKVFAATIEFNQPSALYSFDVANSCPAVTSSGNPILLPGQATSLAVDSANGVLYQASQTGSNSSVTAIQADVFSH